MELIQSPLFLKQFSFVEENKESTELKIQPFEIKNINLIIGNNAQGKTRLLRLFIFIKGLLSNERAKIATTVIARFVFGSILFYFTINFLKVR